jgi:hypothetical protein
VLHALLRGLREGCEEQTTDLSAYEGQELTLYLRCVALAWHIDQHLRL